MVAEHAGEKRRRSSEPDDEGFIPLNLNTHLRGIG
jgi:hypothetical protein